MFLLIRSRLLYPLVLLLLFSNNVQIAVAGQKATIGDLAFGNALFHYFQDKDFEALLALEIAEKQARLTNNYADAQLLAGGLYLSYGMHRHATSRLKPMLVSNPAPELNSKIHYLLGKQQYDLQLYALADAHFDKVDPTKLAYFVPKFYHTAGLNKLHMGAPNDAILLFDKTDSHHMLWRAYSHYNIASTAFSATSFDQAEHQIERLLNLSSGTRELTALQDQGRMLSAHYALRANNTTLAENRLLDIAADSHVAPDSLYLLGQAYLDQHRLREAQSAWTYLLNKTATTVPKDNAYLMLPSVFIAQGNADQAISLYESALLEFRQRMQQIETLKIEIDTTSGIELLIKQALGGNDTNAPSTSIIYMASFVASQQFQNQLRHFRDLERLQSNLLKWQRDLPIFSTMLDTRRTAFARKRPRIEELATSYDIDERMMLAEKFRKELARIKNGQDASALASTDEKEHISDLEYTNELIDGLPADHALKQEFRLRAHRLRGIITWRTHAEFQPRWWRAQKHLLALEASLEKSAKRKSTLASAHYSSTKVFAKHAENIESQRTRIEATLLKLTHLKHTVANRIRDVLNVELDKHSQRLQRYLRHTQVALASARDRFSPDATSRPQP